MEKIYHHRRRDVDLLQSLADDPYSWVVTHQPTWAFEPSEETWPQDLLARFEQEYVVALRVDEVVLWVKKTRASVSEDPVVSRGDISQYPRRVEEN